MDLRGARAHKVRGEDEAAAEDEEAGVDGDEDFAVLRGVVGDARGEAGDRGAVEHGRGNVCRRRTGLENVIVGKMNEHGAAVVV